jgi:hypothetical protein
VAWMRMMGAESVAYHNHRVTILCGHPLTGVGRFPIWPAAQQALQRAKPPLSPTCITTHRRSPAKLPDLPLVARPIVLGRGRLTIEGVTVASTGGAGVAS